jgi:hypothetical protein
MTYTLTVDAEHKRVRLTGAGKSETAQVHCIHPGAFDALVARFRTQCARQGIRVRVDFAAIP